MSVFVDRAGSSRTNCKFCGQPIAQTTMRVVEGSDDDRQTKRHYAHLPCAVEMDRELAKSALVSRDTPVTIVSAVMIELSRLDAKLANEVRAMRERRVPIARMAAQALDDPRTLELLGKLEREPGDRDVLAVLGDHLLQIGDPRGELIGLDLAGSTADDVLVRRRELSGALSPSFGAHSKLVWGIGFLRKVSLWTSSSSLAEHAGAFAHPSCRLLEALQIDTTHRANIAVAAEQLPRTLRTLVVSGTLDCGDLSVLAYLDQLRISGSDTAITHPTVRHLALQNPTPATIAALDPSALPAVTQLSLDRVADPIVGALAERGWLARVTDLSLTIIRFAPGDHEVLEQALAGRKLARLELDPIGNTGVDRDRLSSLCEVLELRRTVAPPPAGPFVEHTGKPEWGRGRVTREADGKLEVEFPSGKRTFKADSPFLKRSH